MEELNKVHEKRLARFSQMHSDLETLTQEQAVTLLTNWDVSICTKKNMAESLLKYLHSPAAGPLVTQHANWKNTVFATYQLENRSLCLPTLDNLQSRLTELYSPTHPFFSLGSLYLFWPLRDDAQMQWKVGEGNIIVPWDDRLEIIVRLSKTKKEGEIARTAPDWLEQRIRKYVADREIKEGEYLWGNRKLSKSLHRWFQTLGLPGGINMLRRVHRLEAVASGDVQRIVTTAECSMHSVRTAAHYDTGHN